MKKYALIILLVSLSSTRLFSQDKIKKDNIQNYNELKLNGLMLILGAIEVTYERTVNQESGIGVTALINFDDDIKYLNYYISPYYRLYFGKKYAAGFFVEGFAMLNSYQDHSYEYYYDENDPYYFNNYKDVTKEKIDLGFGIGLGGKWLTESGFIAELNLAVGRNFLNGDDSDFEIIGKSGITIGYRF